MTHYSKKRKVNDPNKVFCNQVVEQCYREYVQPWTTEKVAVLLDDRHFQSTWSTPTLNVWIAQHNRDEYEKMVATKPGFVETLIHADYSQLKPPHGSVVIDNADFCAGWSTASEILFARLKQAPCFYASRSIVRVTVSARGIVPDRFANQVVHEYQMSAIDTPYCVKPLSIRQWLHNDTQEFDESALDATCFTYSPFMTMFIFLIIKI